MSNSFQFLRLFKGIAGLGGGSSVVALLVSSEELDFDKSYTLGEFLIDTYGHLCAGYTQILTFFSSLEVTTVGVLLVALSSILIKLKNRSIKVTTSKNKPFFDEYTAKQMPWTRIGYSDRMSYLMAELSELAYIQAEPISLLTKKLMAKLNAASSKENNHAHALQEIEKELEGYQTNALSSLKSNLKKGDFELVEPYLQGEGAIVDSTNLKAQLGQLSAQGFVCFHKNEEMNKSFIVVSFRGSESNVEDWLINANAKPFEKEELKSFFDNLKEAKENCNFSTKLLPSEGRVHSGFYSAYFVLAKQIMINIQKAKTKLENQNIPVYFTGHSLGGAMATIAARDLLPDSNGAVYTYGAPCLGDYDYFNCMKTPIFRTVNSCDLVPRMPPGVFMPVFKVPIYVIRWLFAARQGVNNTNPTLAKVLDNVESVIDELSKYRHYGDLRYLTDVPASEATKAEILNNPSRFDQIFWFFTAIGASFGKPVKSHSMQIYRNKISKIAKNRNPDG